MEAFSESVSPSSRPQAAPRSGLQSACLRVKPTTSRGTPGRGPQLPAVGCGDGCAAPGGMSASPAVALLSAHCPSDQGQFKLGTQTSGHSGWGGVVGAQGMPSHTAAALGGVSMGVGGALPGGHAASHVSSLVCLAGAVLPMSGSLCCCGRLCACPVASPGLGMPAPPWEP